MLNLRARDGSSGWRIGIRKNNPTIEFGVTIQIDSKISIDGDGDVLNAKQFAVDRIKAIGNIRK